MKKVYVWFGLQVQKVYDGDTFSGVTVPIVGFSVKMIGKTGKARVSVQVGKPFESVLKVRVKNIDAPEKTQAFGDICSDYLDKLLLGKLVWCRVEVLPVCQYGAYYYDFSKTFDKYGRYLCEVSLKPEKMVVPLAQVATDDLLKAWFYSFESGESLDRHLLSRGLAWHYLKYTNNISLNDLQNEARNAGVGLWKDDSPTPPWVYRKQGKKGG